MNLFLFANRFPYEGSEPFLVNEFNFTRRHFATINVFTLYSEKQIFSVNTQGIDTSPPVFYRFKSKSELLIKGLFNLSPVGFHFRELFKKKILFNPGKLRWFLVSLLIARASINTRTYKKIIQDINSSEKNVLYFYWGDNLVWILPYLCRKIDRKKAKIVIRLHGTDLYEELKNDYAPLRELIFECADHLVPVSEYGRKYIAKKYPQFESKVTVSRLGVFDHGLGPIGKHSQFVIVSASSVIGIKRVKLIFDALMLSSKNIKWHHFGDGPLLQEIRAEVAKLPANISVTLHGHVSNQSLIAFYKSSHVDLFLNVSETEGLPVSIMEAISFGIPVIATDVGGTHEIVNENSGKLIPRETSVEQLKKEIELFAELSDSELKKKRAGARTTFQEKVNADINYSRFYDELMRF